jgi:hypothetical protein
MNLVEFEDARLVAARFRPVAVGFTVDRVVAAAVTVCGRLPPKAWRRTDPLTELAFSSSAELIGWPGAAEVGQESVARTGGRCGDRWPEEGGSAGDRDELGCDRE